MAATGRPLPGYPQAVGDKIESILEIAGPSSYTQVSTGSPPSGGQVIYASQFGLKYIEFVDGSLSDDGQYYADASYMGKTGAVTQVTLLWSVAHTGAEVSGTTNLASRTVRMRAIGPC
jgi:hypothetical protein